MWGVFYNMAEQSIYFPPGNFIYTVWGANKEPLYVGGTQDIMAKSFKFKFPYLDITGEYYDFPSCVFESEIDERIAKLKPRYNLRLRTSKNKKQVIKHIKDLFKKKGWKFTKEALKFIISELEQCDGLVFNGEIFYTMIDWGCIEMEFIEGTWNTR